MLDHDNNNHKATYVSEPHFLHGLSTASFIGQVLHSQSDLGSLTHLLPGSLTLPFTDTSVSVCDFKLRVSAGTILTLHSFSSVSFRKKAQAELLFLCPCSFLYAASCSFPIFCVLDFRKSWVIPAPAQSV